MSDFKGRGRELTDLKKEFLSPRPSLVVVYGRRRIGKSTLLQEAAAGASVHVYFQATKIEEDLNLAAFKAEVGRVLGEDSILAALADWAGVLHWLARAAETRPGLVVILDEFSYLADERAALPSIIQKFWDSGAMRKGNLKLVLCGSLISYMEELLTERNPLFGRRTMALELGAMSLREAAQFLPRYTAEDKIVAYCVFGGVPHYLQSCNPEASLRDNIVHTLLSPSGPLFDEPEFLLQSELRETRRYASIIAAIAAGATKLAEVIGRAPGLKDSAQITPYIEQLVRMRILERQRSFDATPKSRDTRYAIADPVFRFWHRFVRPNLSAIARGFGGEVYDNVVAPQFPQYLGLAFEDLCREHLRLHAQERLPVPAQRIGKIWSGDFDIDIVGTLLDASRVFGECKWETQAISENVLENLRSRADRAVNIKSGSPRHFALFARAGYAEGLREAAHNDRRIVLYDLEELASPPA